MRSMEYEMETESYERAVGFCNDCLEVIGPDWVEDVGGEMFAGDHEEHDTEYLKTWVVSIRVPKATSYGETW